MATLEASLRLNDGFSSKLSTINSKLQQSVKQMSSFQRQVSNMGSSASSALTGLGSKMTGATSSAAKLEAGVMKIAAAFSLVKVAGSVINSIKGSMDSAISRFDTMQKYPKVMQALGYSGEQSTASIKALGDGIDGLPTKLDDIVAANQRMVSISGNIDEATQATLALNNAFLASGADSDKASRGMEQYFKMLSTNKVDMTSWQTMMETMPVSLTKVANAMGKTGESAMTDLGNALKNGEITFKDFQAKLIELGTGTGELAELARINSAGIATSFGNLRNAISKGVANTITKLDELSQKVTGNTIAGHIDNLKGLINKTFEIIQNNVDRLEPLVQKIKPFLDALAEFAKEGKLSAGAIDGMKKSAAGFVKEFGAGMALFAGVMNFSKIQKGLGIVNKMTGGLAQTVGKVSSGFNLGGLIPKMKMPTMEGLSGTSSKWLTKFASGFEKARAVAGTFEQDTVKTLSTIFPKLESKLSSTPNIFSQMFDKADGKILNQMSKVVDQTDKMKKKFMEFNEELPLVSKGVNKMGSGMSKGIQRATNSGTYALSSMFTSIASIAQVGLAAIGPAAIIGTLLVGMGLAYTQFGDQINQFIDLAVTKGPEVIQGFVAGITAKIPELASKGTELVAKLAQAITVLLPVIAQAAMNIITALVQGIASNAPSLINSFLMILQTLAVTILNILPQLIVLGMQLLLALAQGILANVPMIAQTAVTIITTLVNNFVTMLPTIITIGIQIIMTLVQAILSLLPALIPVAVQAIVTLVNGLASAIPMLLQGAVMIIQMLVTGLIQNLPAIVNGAIQIINALIQGITSNIGNIISTGIQIIMMLLIGIIQMLPQIVSGGIQIIVALGKGILQAIPSVLTGAIDGIKNAFSNLWGWITGKSKETGTELTSNLASATQGIESKVNSIDVSGFDTMKTTGTNAFQGWNNAAATEVGQVSDTVISGLGQINLGIAEQTSEMPKLFQDPLSSLNSDLTTNFAELKGTTQTGMTDMVEGMKMPLENLTTDFTLPFQQANTGISTEMTNMQTTVTEGFNGIGDAGIQKFETLSSTISTKMAEIQTNVTTAMDGIKTAFESLSTLSTSTFDGLSTSVSTAMTGVSTAISAGMVVAQMSFVIGMAMMKSTASSSFNTIRSTAMTGMLGLSVAVALGTALATAMLTAGLAQMVSAVRSLYSQMFSAGSYAMQGLAAGIQAGAGSAIAAATAVANQVSAAVKSAMDIHSPSRVMMALGNFVTQGLAKGILAAESLVVSASNAIANAAVPDAWDTSVNGEMQISDSEISRLKASATNTVTVENRQVVPQVTVNVDNNGGDLDESTIADKVCGVILEAMDADLA